MPRPTTNRPPTRAGRLALLTCTLALAACGGSEPASPSGPSGTPTPPPRPAESALPPLDAGTLERPHVYPPALRYKVDALDPAAAGVLSEVAADRAQAVLERLGAALVRDRTLDGLIAADLASARFRCAFEARERGTTVHSSSAFVVTRAGLLPASEEAREGPGALVAGLRVLLAPLEGGRVVKASFETDRVELDEDGAFRTESVVRVAGRTADGRPWQQNARWTCGWTEDPESGATRLASLAVGELEDVSGTRPEPTFADATRAVLGDGPAVDALRHGATYWNGSLDKALGTSIFGHNGLAIGDANGDGLDDVYACQPGGIPNQLWLQRPDGTAREAAAELGLDVLDLSRSALLLDLDDDGDQDLALATSKELAVFESVQDGGRRRFELRVQLELDSIHSLSAADVDGDRLLDLYVCRYSQTDSSTPTPYHDADDGPPNVLLRNAGGFELEDATAAFGLDDENHRYSFAAAFADHDLDGDLDLYVANDFGRNNLYENEGGRFRDVAGERAAQDLAAGMSVAWADYDGDGAPDLYVGNMFSAAGSRMAHQPGFRDEATREHYRRHARGNTLLRNAGDGRYEDATLDAGVNVGRWAWASSFVDVDDDGMLDLAVANGYLTGDTDRSLCSFFWREVVGLSPNKGEKPGDSYEDGWTALNELQRHGWTFAGNEPNVLCVNTGDGRFADASFVAGFDHTDDARGLAACDWDLDGALDLWLTSRTAPRLRFLRNTTPAGDAFVAIRLEGTACNRDAIGARVELELAGGRRLARTLQAGEAFLSQSSKWVHFGLGADARPERVRVAWPHGATETFEDVARGGRYLLREGSGAAARWPATRDALPELGAGELEPAAAEPAAFTLLAAPVPAHGLAYVGDDGARRPLSTLAVDGGRPLCVVLFSTRNEPSRALLAALQHAGGGRDVELLALRADGTAEDGRARLAEAGWAHRAGAAGPDLVDVLAVYRDAIFTQPAPLELPAGLVLDTAGRIVAVFDGDVSADAALAPAALEDLDPAARRAAATPFAGRWLEPPAPAQILALAAQLRRYGYTDAAQAFLERMSVGDDPRARERLADARELLGRELATAGDHAGAVRELEACLELDPARAKVRIELGNSLRALGRPDEALARFREALELAPENGDAHYSIGLMHALAGELDLARSSFEAAVRYDPTSDLAHFNLAIAKANSGDLDGALTHLERALELRPDYAQASGTLGSILLQRGDAARAAEVYRAALEHAPRDAELLFNLGRASLAAGDTAGASAALEELRRSSPDLAARLERELGR